MASWFPILLQSRTSPNEETIYYFLYAFGKLGDTKSPFVMMDMLSKAQEVKLEWAMIHFYTDQFLRKLPGDIIERTIARIDAVWKWNEKCKEQRLHKREVQEVLYLQHELKRLRDSNNKPIFTLPFEAHRSRVRW